MQWFLPLAGNADGVRVAYILYIACMTRAGLPLLPLLFVRFEEVTVATTERRRMGPPQAPHRRTMHAAELMAA